QQLRALRKQLTERLSAPLGFFQIIDIKWRAVALQQLAAKAMVDHGYRKKTSGQTFRELVRESLRDRPFLHCPSQEMPGSVRTTAAPFDAAWQAESDRSMPQARSGFGR